MSIKKTFAITMTVAMLSLVPGVYAQSTTDLPSPGITPDSPLYFLDTWGEDIGLALTRDPEAKTRKQVAISQEKLAEVEQMAEEGKVEATETASNRYGEMVGAAAEGVAAAAKSGEGFADALAELLATTASISQSVLASVYDKVPEQAKSAIQRAMQTSTRGTERAVEAVSNARRGQVQEQVEQNLQNARESAPDEAQQYLPTAAPTDGQTAKDQQDGSAPVQVPAVRGR